MTVKERVTKLLRSQVTDANEVEVYVRSLNEEGKVQLCIALDVTVETG